MPLILRPGRNRIAQLGGDARCADKKEEQRGGERSMGPNFLANRSAAIDARTKNERARRVPLSAGLGGIFTSNVRGNACQVAELVAPAVDRARDRPRDSCAVKRKVSERDNIVITAMVEEKPWDQGELLS